MSKALVSAKLTLSYPLYACDFDPSDATTLVVGGGGGAGRSGVGNKITALNTSNPHELERMAEIDLSKDEDNVTSLAVAQGRGNTKIIYAGVNSSLKDREKGNNEHFRIYGLETFAASKKAQETSAKILELSRSSLFEGVGKETYQRVLRLSKPFSGSAQLGAATTAFGSKGDEIVLFDTGGSAPTAPHVQGRVKLDREAEDVDIIQTGKNQYQCAYCTKYDIFLKTVSSETTPSDQRCITPATTKEERGSKPTFRSLRFLSPEFLLMLINLPGRSGAVLQILRLPSNDSARASQSLLRRLPSHVRQATGLAVCNLSPRASSSEPQGYAQFVIAVAGHDMSIPLYRFEYQREGSISMVTKLKPIRTLNDVHPFQITGLSLSTFIPPTDKTFSPSLKLASISAGNTVVLHTLPLARIPKTSPPRYMVSGSSDTGPLSFSVVATIMATLLFAFFAQVFLEVRGESPAYLNASKYVAPDVQQWIRLSHPIANHILGTPKPIASYTQTSPLPTAPTHPEVGDQSFASFLGALISEQAQNSFTDGNKPVVIIREEPSDPSAQHETSGDVKSSIKAGLHDEAVHGPHGGKTWDELTKEERERWMKKLKDAGHWAEDFGESILKSVVFGMAGAAVGAAAGG